MASKTLNDILEELLTRTHAHGGGYECSTCKQAKADLEAWAIEQRIDELKGLLDAQIIKPEYHNLVVGKINEYRSKANESN